MPFRSGAIALLMLASTAAAAQQPTPLLGPEPPDAPAPSVPPMTAPQPEALAPPPADQPAQEPQPQPGRVFCGQNVTYRLADRGSIPEPYRRFVGIWSDADWTPSLCAALIVEGVQADGTATITYAFGPLGANQRTPGGVLHGTGIIRDGQLQFRNTDGSQFVFKPFYADLQGELTTALGQTYQAVFKRTY